jgi:hypothetical protein
MPDTIKRSPAKAQRTWHETRDNAINEYGDGRRAHQTAYAALKDSFEKVGDRWEPKVEKGPSDSRSERGHGRPGGRTFGGVDVNQPKEALMERARGLEIPGRSRMTKEELADAIAKRQ